MRVILAYNTQIYHQENGKIDMDKLDLVRMSPEQLQFFWAVTEEDYEELLQYIFSNFNTLQTAYNQMLKKEGTLKINNNHSIPDPKLFEGNLEMLKLLVRGFHFEHDIDILDLSDIHSKRLELFNIILYSNKNAEICHTLFPDLFHTPPPPTPPSPTPAPSPVIPQSVPALSIPAVPVAPEVPPPALPVVSPPVAPAASIPVTDAPVLPHPEQIPPIQTGPDSQQSMFSPPPSPPGDINLGLTSPLPATSLPSMPAIAGPETPFSIGPSITLPGPVSPITLPKPVQPILQVSDLDHPDLIRMDKEKAKEAISKSRQEVLAKNAEMAAKMRKEEEKKMETSLSNAICKYIHGNVQTVRQDIKIWGHYSDGTQAAWDIMIK